MDSSVDPLQACGEYAKDTANVEQCAPNFLAAMLEVYKPDDPLYSSGGSFGQLYLDQWGTRKMRLEHFWNGTRGAGMVVAVVDTGIDMNHPDLADNIWFNTNESLGGGDGDGNGYAQDFHGWNFVDGNNDPTDRNGHGTHVSGILGAAGNNGIGMIGVAPEVAIMPVRALDEKGNGTVSNLAQAIIYAAANGADVINNSWGCKTSCPKNPLVEDAVRFAKALGAEVVFAAGNSGAAIDVPASFRRLAAGSGPMSGCRCPTPCAKNEGSGQFTVFYWPAVLVAGH
ncbi:MAG: S8 family serine peptidase [Deltaproteobacteria bacterium]|nr:S8 family serine peptidase [Deltaproteobacteria bacterium]